MLSFFLSTVEEQYKSKFEYIYYKYRDVMASVAKSMTENEESAEDALSLAFLSIAENISIIKTNDEKRLRGYLVTVIRNVCINKFNKKSSPETGECFADSEDISFEEIDKNIEDKNICEIIIKNILAMPEPYKCALYLRYVHGHTVKEICKMTSENENTVKSRIRRGTLLLREILNKAGINES